MKKNILFGFLGLLIFFIQGCDAPKVALQEGKQYTVGEWAGGNFYYTTYAWKGGEFAEAIAITREFGELVKQRAKSEISLGYYPDQKNWKIGMLSEDTALDITVRGQKALKQDIPSGSYATMNLTGFPDKFYTIYNNFTAMLKKDGYSIESGFYEIYNYDTFNNPAMKEAGKSGQLKCKVTKK